MPGQIGHPVPYRTFMLEYVAERSPLNLASRSHLGLLFSFVRLDCVHLLLELGQQLQRHVLPLRALLRHSGLLRGVLALDGWLFSGVVRNHENNINTLIHHVGQSLL